MEDIKKNQMGNLQLKNTITKRKNSVDGLDGRIKRMEGRINEL